MLRIGEFSALSSISINMLRHYDKIGLLVPEHVDSVSGYRYYDKDQLVWSNRIVALKEMGFGLEEIKEVNAMSQPEIQDLLEHKLSKKEKEARQIENQILKIKEAMKSKGVEEEFVFSVVTKTIPEMWVVSFRDRINDFPKEGILWSTLMKECQEQGIKVSKTAVAMAINYEMNEEKNNLDVEVRLSLDKPQECQGKIKIYKLAECKVASLIYQGSYTKISSINSFVAKWLESNKYEIAGKVFSIYHNSPREGGVEENFVTEICFPIIKKCIDSRTI